MTSTIASPIATMSRLEEVTGRVASRAGEARSTAVAWKAKAVTHSSHDRPAALNPAFALRFVHLLWRHGVHRRCARQQAGRAWAARRRSWNLCLPPAGRDLELGRRASWPTDCESAGADRLHPAADLAGAEPHRACTAAVTANGSCTALGL